MLPAGFVQYNLRPTAKTGWNPDLLQRRGSGTFLRLTERVASPFCCLIETAAQ